MGFRIVTEASVARLREADWPWPEVDVEFKAGERGVSEEPVVEKKEAITEAGDKPKRKKSEATASAVADTETVTDAMAIRFSNKLVNEYNGFSNFAPTPFRVTGPQIPASDGTVYPELGVAANGSVDVGQQTWPTVEHYYQAMKFPLDAAWQEEIRRAPTPMKAKQLGSRPDHPARGDWEKIKEQVIKVALLAKFRQNPALLSLLQGTGERRLLEASSTDIYWGIGPKGKGLNRMGVLLTEVRTELKDVRPDKEFLAPIEKSETTTEESSETSVAEESSPEETVEGAEAAVASAMEVVPKQNGGVYLFINSAVPGGVEQKSRRARQRGGEQRISWAGSETVSSEGGEKMEMGGGAVTEVKVEKLGS
jgi:hypothetical protein